MHAISSLHCNSSNLCTDDMHRVHINDRPRDCTTHSHSRVKPTFKPDNLFFLHELRARCKEIKIRSLVNFSLRWSVFGHAISRLYNFTKKFLICVTATTAVFNGRFSLSWSHWKFFGRCLFSDLRIRSRAPEESEFYRRTFRWPRSARQEKGQRRR